MNPFDFIKTAYNKFFSEELLKYEPITQAGSNRNYFRLYNNYGSIVGVYSENIKETETFLYYSEIFTNLGLNTPEIYFINDDKKVYFIQDFGEESLLNIVEKETKNSGFSEYLIELYKKSISALVKMQLEAYPNIDFSKSYSISEFNKGSILFDLNQFKYYFLNFAGISCNEKKLQDDFESFAEFLSSSGEKYFMFRDFQARNIMIKDGEPYFIDYQGGRKGAIQYDLASLLYQAKAKIPDNIKEELLEFYISQVSKYIKIDIEKFKEQFYYYVYIRIFQTLGTYGIRGLIEKKTHFIESIPFAVKNLKYLAETKPYLKKYKELTTIIDKLSTEKFENITYEKFTITVSSFSFKKGYPEDRTGNGGGFVFDCRGILNPGRYEEYKTKTGRDHEVIKFFKEKTDIDEFVSNIIKVIGPTIENYIQRNFNSLSISFGCTGGQHRSVYCAENIFKYLNENYKNISIKLNHRELGISEN